jgi:hypothetical protein
MSHLGVSAAVLLLIIMLVGIQDCQNRQAHYKLEQYHGCADSCNDDKFDACWKNTTTECVDQYRDCLDGCLKKLEAM